MAYSDIQHLNATNSLIRPSTGFSSLHSPSLDPARPVPPYPPRRQTSRTDARQGADTRGRDRFREGGVVRNFSAFDKGHWQRGSFDLPFLQGPVENLRRLAVVLGSKRSGESVNADSELV